MRFAEVSGLSVEIPAEEVAEGGENRFVQRYPGRARYSELVLKRGLLPGSQVVDWIRKCAGTLAVEPRDVDVTLLNEEHQPLLTWHVVKAWPTRWAVSDFNAASNAVVIETLQLCYQHFWLDRG